MKTCEGYAKWSPCTKPATHCAEIGGRYIGRVCDECGRRLKRQFRDITLRRIRKQPLDTGAGNG